MKAVQVAVVFMRILPSVHHAVARRLSRVLVLLLLAIPATAAADEVVAKTIFLVDESDRIVAANTATGQFFLFPSGPKRKFNNAMWPMV